MSPQVQNRGVSGPPKRTYLLNNHFNIMYYPLQKKEIRRTGYNLISDNNQLNVPKGTMYTETKGRMANLLSKQSDYGYVFM